MTHSPRREVDVVLGSDGDQRWAELADLILIISREIQFRGYTEEQAIALSPSEGVVMRYLQGQPAATPGRIAVATGLQRTNLSTVLRGLEHKGLVERHASPRDGREVTVHVTERGRSNYALVRREWAAAISAAASDDTTSLDPALALLAAIRAGLIDTRPASPPPRPVAGI